jgi:hypothetical protein
MRFRCDLLDREKAPKSTDLQSALLAAEAALLDLAGLIRTDQFTRAETSDQVGVTSHDPCATLGEIVLAMTGVVQCAAIQAGDSNARSTAKAATDLDRGVARLRGVSQEFGSRADSTEGVRLALIAFNAAAWVLYNAKSIDSASNDHGPDDDPPDDVA